MTNTELIQEIKAEIERRIGAIAKAPSDNGVMDSINGARGHELMKLLSFLSTLESEKPVPNDLEDAAGEYEKNHTYQRYDGGGLTPEYDATLAEAFIAGYNLCKEQMLKGAVEGYIERDLGGQLILGRKNAPAGDEFMILESTLFPEIHTGEHSSVRIIIVKEDEK